MITPGIIGLGLELREIQVRLENASFDDIIRWLHEMEYSQGLLVSEVSITQAGAIGRVNASIRIAQGV